MSKTYVLSDSHFFHSNIIKYCNRPFSSYEEMNNYMIKMWCDTITDNDKVYHLGDFTFKKSNIFSSLPGRKVLILGNHDDIKKHDLNNIFSEILASHKITIKDKKVILSHHPIYLDSEDMTCVHGHIHDKTLKSNKHINVSVEKIEYKPIEMEKVFDI